MRAPVFDRSDDAALVRQYLDTRSEAAFRSLYRRYTPRIYGVVFRMLGGDVQETQDVVQEAWIRVAERLATFRWESSLATWVTSVAINVARNHYRSRRVREDRELADVSEMPAPPRIERAIDSVDMARAVARLAEGYREVIVLHDVHGYTHDEIAEMLGIASGTSKSQLTRARRALRRLLTQTGDENDERRIS